LKLCPNYVQEFGRSYFTGPFAIAIRLEMRLSVSPATSFSDASLPNHTKMFKLVHVITSTDDSVDVHCVFFSTKCSLDVLVYHFLPAESFVLKMPLSPVPE
jgi:hypothetical protein